jgi:hypothetical protein
MYLNSAGARAVLTGRISEQFVAGALPVLFGGDMAHPNLPSYLGTWEELVQALSNKPFLGSGRARQPQLLHSLTERKGPQPDPWSPACALFVVTAGLKDIVSRLPEGQKSQLGTAIMGAADDWEDWYCGNGPGPGPHVIETAGEMLAFAGTLGAGGLRSGIVREAGILLEKSFGAAQEPAQGTSVAS